MAVTILVGRTPAEQQDYIWFTSAWKQALLKRLPNLDIRIWPDIGNPDEIAAALVWLPPQGLLATFPKLTLIASLAAGVDHIFLDTDLPKNIPIVRVTDPYMQNDIVQYVVACVLNHIKRMEHWRIKQQEKTWYKQPPFNFAHKTIAVMGMGFLGKQAADSLHKLGLRVIAWSASAKNMHGIQHYTGQAELPDFLAQADVLVCMLPLTPDTKNILNQTTFAQLPPDAYLINVGRGEHLVEADLLSALASGQLSGAALDVFRQEPLPAEHPFWSHAKISVTPHIASVTNPETAAIQVADNIRRMQRGEPLMNVVDVNRGY